MVPPFVQHALADQFEPRRELQRLVLEHGLQVVLRDVTRISDFVGVDIKIDVGFYEEDVVDWSL